MRTPIELVAKHIDSGDWEFKCPLHEPELVFTSVSSYTLAPEKLRTHMDTEHQGVRVTIRIILHGKHFIHYYTGMTIIDTGELL